MRFFSFTSLKQLLREEGFRVLEEHGFEANLLHRNPYVDWIVQKFRGLATDIALCTQPEG